MSLATQNVPIDQFNWSNYASWPEPSEGPTLHGMAWAYDLHRLRQAAREGRRPWHMLLLERSLVGLARLGTTQTLLAGYVGFPTFLQLLLFARTDRDWTKFHEPVSEIAGFTEGGSAFAQPGGLKLLALREGRRLPVALWPCRKVDGPGILDAGTGLGYYSLPQPPEGLNFDSAGPDFVQVPSASTGSVDWRGRSYEYENRVASWPSR